MSLGPAPDSTAVAALLRERWITEPATDLGVHDRLREGRPRLEVTIDRGKTPRRMRERIVVDVTHLRGARSGEAWSDLVDAVDALIGQLAESGFAHRDLPVGTDVEFGEGVYWVDVTMTRPEVESDADRLLR